LALHFTWVLDSDAVRQLLPSLEAVLEPFGARPHWGKVFTTSPEQVRRMYPRRQDFAELVHQYDPTGKFSNAFLQTYVL
jgi:xylitol oxidase